MNLYGGERLFLSLPATAWIKSCLFSTFEPLHGGEVVKRQIAKRHRYVPCLSGGFAERFLLSIYRARSTQHAYDQHFLIVTIQKQIALRYKFLQALILSVHCCGKIPLDRFRWWTVHYVFAKNMSYSSSNTFKPEVVQDPECRSRLRQDSAFFFRTRSQKFVKNRTEIQSHSSISAIAGVSVVLS